MCPHHFSCPHCCCPNLSLDLFPLDYRNNGLSTELPLKSSTSTFSSITTCCHWELSLSLSLPSSTWNSGWSLLVFTWYPGISCVLCFCVQLHLPFLPHVLESSSDRMCSDSLPSLKCFLPTCLLGKLQVLLKSPVLKKKAPLLRSLLFLKKHRHVPLF